MATRLYFRDIVSDNAPTSGTKSTALPDGTDNSLSVNSNQTLHLTQGTANTTVSITTLAQLTRQSGKFARFTSHPLATQTISSNTWNYTLRNRTANTASNTYKAGSIYVWRPSTSSVVGYIYDSANEIGTSWTVSYTDDSADITGSSVSVLSGDVLVCEVWYTALQGKAKSYTNDIQYNVSSFIETPQDLTFNLVSREVIFMTIID